MRSETRRLGARFPTAIQDEELMPSERRFRDHGTKATRFYKPNGSDDRMNENDEDVVHDRIEISNNPRIQTDFVIRHRQVLIPTVCALRPAGPATAGRLAAA